MARLGVGSRRIEADRSFGSRLGFTAYDARGVACARIVSTSIADSAWAVVGSDGISYAPFILAIGGHRLAFEPSAPAQLRALLAAFLLDYDRMLLEAGSRPQSVDKLHLRLGHRRIQKD
ncbi:hypothetical protein [Nocardia sp. Marseille-Q1738]